jgi:hypothetical protein
MPARQPAVVSLLVNRIDHLETSLSGSIVQMQEHLGTRITDLTERVKVQNSRIAKCEDAIHAEEVEVARAMSNAQPINRKQVALIGGTGLVSGAVILELLGRLGEWLHRIGALG